MKKVWLLIIFTMIFVACGDKGGPTSPTVPAPPTTTEPMPTPQPTIPILTSHDARIVRSSGDYHFIAWKFTIDSPRHYGYAYVEARWFDAENFQIKWTNWVGALLKGIHTYSDETMIQKVIWAQVVQREVVLESYQ